MKCCNFALLLIIILLTSACENRYISEFSDTGSSTIEYDITKYVRILASDTKKSDGFNWVREAEDSIFTIRDDILDTCYKAPDSGSVTITLDIYAIYHRQIPISSLNIQYILDRNVDFDVRLKNNCNGDESYSTHTTFETQLNLEQRPAGCVEIAFISQRGLQICSIAIRSTERPVIKEIPPIKNSNVERLYGVIEGFYGVRWSDTEREKIFITLNRYGMGMYVYAPKDEPKHRKRWREGYTDEEMERFANLSKKAAEYGVDFYYAISPFIDFEYETQDDLILLKDKLSKFASYGIRNLAIFADDIEVEKDIKVDSELGRNHTEITNKIYRELKIPFPDLRMLFVGTVYSNERAESFEDGHGYLREIKNLERDINIFWTGLKTSGATLNKDDFSLFTFETGRRPVVWDNFWANDGGDLLFGRLFLSDYTGREKDIRDITAGIGINPLIQGSITRFNLMRFGTWMRGGKNSEWYDNEIDLFGYGDQCDNRKYTIDNLKLLTEIFNGNSNSSIKYGELETELENLYTSIGSKDSTLIIQSIIKLSQLFSRMYVLQSALYNSCIDTELFDEIYYPSEKVKYDALTGIYGLKFLISKLNGSPEYSLEKKMRSAFEKSSSQRYIYSAGKMEQFINFISDYKPDGDIDIKTLSVLQKIPTDCISRKPLSFRPFENATNIELYGLPEGYFTIEGEQIKLSIPVAGSYMVSVIGYNETGINVLIDTIRCR